MSAPSTEHLDVVALEALATGRDDLVPEAALAHLDECELCAARVADEHAAAEDASLALRRAMPELDDLDAMIVRAMAQAPARIDEAREVVVAPSGRSLWVGAGVGALLAAGLGILSLPEASSLAGLGTAGRQALTLMRAADRVVDSAVPGGWIGIALLGLLSALLLAIPTRLLLRGAPGSGGSLLTSAVGGLLLAVIVLPALPAHAYRVDGAWPEPQPAVNVDVDRQPTSEALRQAAASAGLGVVVQLEDDALVTMHVRGAPIGEVVEALLGERAVVVRPGASLITVRPDTELSAPSEPVEGASAEGAVTGAPSDTPAAGAPVTPTLHAPTLHAPTQHAPTLPLALPPIPLAPPPTPSLVLTSGAGGAGLADLVTLGDDAEVSAEQEVRGVYTMGGDATVRGRAYGDVVTMGGDATVEGAVVGNVTTMGGDIAVGPGARVHGDLNAMGGDVRVDESAVLHGRVIGARGAEGSAGPGVHVARADGLGDAVSPELSRWALWNALLFLFGLVMLGAYRERFSTLRSELSARPVRSAFGGLFGLLAGSALGTAFTLSVLGIPAAMVIGLLLASGYIVGWGTSAWWIGSVLPIPALKERPVLQLALGVGLSFLLGLVPKIGSVLVVAAALAGLGAVIATSFGQNPRRPKPRVHVPTGPFRA